MTWKSVLIGIAAALAGGAILGPWYLGGRAEQAYHQVLDDLGHRSADVRILQEHFERGWLSSVADVELALPSTKPADGQSLEVHSRIEHGPAVFAERAWPPTIARIASEVEIRQQAVDDLVAQATTRVVWGGATDTRVSLPAGNHCAPDGVSCIRAEAGSVEIRVEPGSGVATELELPEWDFVDQDGVVLASVRGLTGTSASTAWSSGMGIGSVHLSVGEFRGHEPDLPIAARDLDLSLETQAEGGLLSLRIRARAGGLRIDGADFAPAHCNMRIGSLEGSSLVSMQEDLWVLAAGDLPEAMSRMARLAVIMKHLPDLAASDPTIALDGLEVPTPAGPVKARMSLGVRGLAASDIRSPRLFKRRLVGDGELSLPKAIAQALLERSRQLRERPHPALSQGREGHPDADARRAGDIAEAQLQGLIDEGWLEVDGKRLTAAVRLADGLLTVNGKTVPLNGTLRF